MDVGSPEAEARKQIDQQLAAAGWRVQHRSEADINAAPGVAIREFPLKSGPVDYVLYVDGAVAGAVEAKKEGLDPQRRRGPDEALQRGPPGHPSRVPTPTAVPLRIHWTETHFTNLLDPDPRARPTFAFHRPETMRDWLVEAGLEAVRSMPGEDAKPIPDDLRTNMHFTLKTNPLKRSDLDDLVACYNTESRHDRTESERFKAFSYDELINRDKTSLDIFWLMDESLEDSENLPDPAVLAAEIVEDLQAALDQFAQIASDLAFPPRAIEHNDALRRSRASSLGPRST